MTTKQARPRLLLGVSLAIVLACGTSSYAGDIGDEAAQAALAKKAATDAANAKAEADRKANVSLADQKKKEREAAAKRKADEAETARIAKLQTKCEKDGGDWKKGKCVMLSSSKKPKPQPAPEPVIANNPTSTFWKRAKEALKPKPGMKSASDVFGLDGEPVRPSSVAVMGAHTTGIVEATATVDDTNEATVGSASAVTVSVSNDAEPARQVFVAPQLHGVTAFAY